VVHVISSSSIDTQQELPPLVLASPDGTWSLQLRSVKSSRSGDSDTCRAQPLHHPQIFDIADAPVMVRLAAGLEKLARPACRIGLANAAYNRRRLAIRSISTWINCCGAFICTRSGNGGCTRLQLPPKSD
jgi:hypothetical protein